MSQTRNLPATYPELTINELIESCKLYNLNITQDDLVRPSPARVQSVYLWWMSLLLGLNFDDVIKATDMQMDHMETSDIYRDPMYINVLHKALFVSRSPVISSVTHPSSLPSNQLMVRASIDNFVTRDLTMPDPSRFQNHLAGLINFYLFEQEQATEYYEPLQAEDEELERKEEESRARVEELKIAIEETRERRRLNIPKIEEANSMIKIKTQEVVGLRDKSHYLQPLVVAESERIKKVHSEVSEINQTTTNQSIELKRLQSMIIQSPVRMQITIKDMGLKLAADQEEVKRLENKERLMGIKISNLTKFESDLGSCARILDDWAVDVQKASEATKRYQEHYDTLESLQSERADYEQRINLLMRRINNAREELERNDEKTERKRSANKQRKKSLEDHLAGLVEQKRKLDVEAAEKNRSAIEVENKIREIYAEVHAEFDRGAREYKKVKDQVNLYSIKLNKALDSITQLNMTPVAPLLKEK